MAEGVEITDPEILRLMGAPHVPPVSGEGQAVVDPDVQRAFSSPATPAPAPAPAASAPAAPAAPHVRSIFGTWFDPLLPSNWTPERQRAIAQDMVHDPVSTALYSTAEAGTGGLAGTAARAAGIGPNRAEYEQMRQNNPWSSVGGDIAGTALATSALGKGLSALGWAGRGIASEAGKQGVISALLGLTNRAAGDPNGIVEHVKQGVSEGPSLDTAVDFGLGSVPSLAFGAGSKFLFGRSKQALANRMADWTPQEKDAIRSVMQKAEDSGLTLNYPQAASVVNPSKAYQVERIYNEAKAGGGADVHNLFSTEQQTPRIQPSGEFRSPIENAKANMTDATNAQGVIDYAAVPWATRMSGLPGQATGSQSPVMIQAYQDALAAIQRNKMTMAEVKQKLGTTSPGPSNTAAMTHEAKRWLSNAADPGKASLFAGEPSYNAMNQRAYGKAADEVRDALYNIQAHRGAPYAAADQNYLKNSQAMRGVLSAAENLSAPGAALPAVEAPSYARMAATAIPAVAGLGTGVYDYYHERGDLSPFAKGAAAAGLMASPFLYYGGKRANAALVKRFTSGYRPSLFSTHDPYAEAADTTWQAFLQNYRSHPEQQ